MYARGVSPTRQDKWVKAKPVETKKFRPFKPTIYVEPVVGKDVKRDPVIPWKKRTLVHMGMGFVPIPIIHNRRKILARICRKHNVTLAALISNRRTKHLVRARQEAMYCLREELNLSYPEIGRELGGRDHTTVIHGVKQHEKLLASVL